MMAGGTDAAALLSLSGVGFHVLVYLFSFCLSVNDMTDNRQELLKIGMSCRELVFFNNFHDKHFPEETIQPPGFGGLPYRLGGAGSGIAIGDRSEAAALVFKPD